MFENIKNKFKSMLGLDIDNTHESYLKDISDEVTNMFYSTKVNVYVIEMDNINAFTIPNVTKTYGLSIGILRYILAIGPFFISLCQLVDILINYSKYRDQLKNGAVVTFDPSTRKCNTVIPEINVFIGTKLIEKLNHDEIIASIFHEIGHNMNVTYSIIEQLKRTIIFGSFMAFVNSLFSFTFADDSENDNKHLSIMVVSGATLLLLMLYNYLNMYKERKKELHADTFAIKMGYGKQLLSVINKMKVEYNEEFEKLYRRFNNIDENEPLTPEQKEELENYKKEFDNIKDTTDTHLIYDKRQKFLDDKIKEYNDDIKNKRPITQTYDLSNDYFEEVLANIIRDTWAINS